MVLTACLPPNCCPGTGNNCNSRSNEPLRSLPRSHPARDITRLRGIHRTRPDIVFWFFIIPPLAALRCADRYLDFLPNEGAKSWSFLQRAGHHFFSVQLWEIRPVIADHAIESDKDLLRQLPYIYSPVQAWVELLATVATAVVSWRAAVLFSLRVEPPTTSIA